MVSKIEDWVQLNVRIPPELRRDLEFIKLHRRAKGERVTLESLVYEALTSYVPAELAPVRVRKAKR